MQINDIRSIFLDMKTKAYIIADCSSGVNDCRNHRCSSFSCTLYKDDHTAKGGDAVGVAGSGGAGGVAGNGGYGGKGSLGDNDDGYGGNGGAGGNANGGKGNSGLDGAD